MTLHPAQAPDWDCIDTLLLDLDGTLLNLDFDNYFWRVCIPTAYAAAQSLTPEAARSALLPRFRACEGRLDWYCIDYWSRELSLDVGAMHHAERAHIGWLPGAEGFLGRMRQTGKRLVLATNAHPETLRIKDGETGVRRYLDAAFSSHTFGAPKENPLFWERLRKVEPYDPQRTLFVDDSLPVLRAARAAGIRWICAVRRPDGRNAEVAQEFYSVGSVAELH